MIGDATAYYPVIRGLFFITLLLLTGTQAASWIVARQLLDTNRDASRNIRGAIRTLVTRLALLLLALSFARAAAQLWSLKDPADFLSWDFTQAVLLDGTWGTAWIVQTSAAVLLLALSLLASRHFARHDALASLLILAALWSQTGMGHAASSFWNGPLGRGLEFAHLVGGGIWLGTLGVLAIAVFPVLGHGGMLPQLSGVLRDFSTLARTGAALVVLAGLLITLKYAGSLSAFLAAPWGRLLMVKIACLSGVAGLGWYNWRVVTPGIVRGDIRGAARLRRAVQMEIALGLVMLGITSFLVATQLPREL